MATRDAVRVARVVALLATALLAGCSQPRAAAGNDGVIVVASSDGASGNAAALQAHELGKPGHLAGVVVDEAIRPIEGARVDLPGYDRNETSDRDGGFGFVDLPPGSYFVRVDRAGYIGAETVVDVHPGEFTRTKFVLTSIPPPQPYHETQTFNGFSEVTGPADLVQGSLVCQHCQFPFASDSAGRTAIVIEATMAPYSGPSGHNGFFFVLGNATLWIVPPSSNNEPNPMRSEVRETDLQGGQEFHAELEPYGDPAPEANKAFQVFVTTFYYANPPTGWSFLHGDP